MGKEEKNRKQKEEQNKERNSVCPQPRYLKYIYIYIYIYIFPNARIRELCGVKKGLDERMNEGVLRWFDHVERMERDRIAKRVYVGGCAGSRSLGRPRKRWIDTIKECLRKRGLDVRQARRMVQDRIEWPGFVRGNAWGIA